MSNSAPARDRSRRGIPAIPPIRRHALDRAAYVRRHIVSAHNLARLARLVGPGRFELPTSRLSSARSNQLSYGPAPVARTTRSRERRGTRLSRAIRRSITWPDRHCSGSLGLCAVRKLCANLTRPGLSRLTRPGLSRLEPGSRLELGSRPGLGHGADLSHDGGAERIRTDDPLLAKQVLSQLSYSPEAVLGTRKGTHALRSAQ